MIEVKKGTGDKHLTFTLVPFSLINKDILDLSTDLLDYLLHKIRNEYIMIR